VTDSAPLTLEDLERLEAEFKSRSACFQVRGDDVILELCAALRSVMAERDALNGHLNAALRGLRDEQLARAVLKARVLDLRSMFVNLRWDGPNWIKTEEKLAMDLATELAGGKPLDS
jgi:hypothetical protein